MTKLVPLDSIEHGIREALRHLGDDGACDAVEQHTGQRKSASLLRKCADPDDIRHNIQLRDAAALDRACVAVNYPPPLLRAYEGLVQDDSKRLSNSDLDLCHMAVAIAVAAGAVGEAVLRTKDCGTCACPRGQHSREILSELEELEHAIAELRKAVVEQSRTETA